MRDHFIKNHTLHHCCSCGQDLSSQIWQSQWELNQYYKTNTCQKCGKKTWIKVDFLGSGDDNWKPPEQ